MSVVIYDALGRPVETSAARRPDVRELAVVQVRDRWSGYPSNGLTPERLARIFREADHGDMLRQAELFEEPPRIANGMLTLKEQPGLGLILSEAALKKFGEKIL